MYKLPPIELLQESHDFPGPFMFKVIGKSENGFVARVVAAVRQQLRLEIDPAYSFRQAAKGRHVAVTLEPQMQSAQEVLDVYQCLGKLDGLVMLW